MCHAVYELDSSSMSILIIQADNRPVQCWSESKELVYDDGSDAVSRMLEINGGSLTNKWTYWSTTSIVNKRKCEDLGYDYKYIKTYPDVHHPGRSPHWAKISLLRDQLINNPGMQVIVYLDSDAWIRDSCSLKETLENPSHPRENIRVSAGADWVHGQQAARIR